MYRITVRRRCSYPSNVGQRELRGTEPGVTLEKSTVRTTTGAAACRLFRDGSLSPHRSPSSLPTLAIVTSPRPADDFLRQHAPKQSPIHRAGKISECDDHGLHKEDSFEDGYNRRYYSQADQFFLEMA